MNYIPCRLARQGIKLGQLSLPSPLPLHPVMDIWMGPILGIIFPFLLLLIPAKKNVKGILFLFCAICLTGNGLYIGLGWLILFGLPTTLAGLSMLMKIKDGNSKKNTS